MLRSVMLVGCLVSGAASAANADLHIYTEGTCIKSGISGLASSKSGCDSIGGVWRSKRSQQVLDAVSGTYTRDYGPHRIEAPVTMEQQAPSP